MLDQTEDKEKGGVERLFLSFNKYTKFYLEAFIAFKCTLLFLTKNILFQILRKTIHCSYIHSTYIQKDIQEKFSFTRVI